MSEIVHCGLCGHDAAYHDRKGCAFDCECRLSAGMARHPVIADLRTRLESAERHVEEYRHREIEARYEVEQLQRQLEVAEAVARLHLHISRCAQCSGPNDGCDEGQELEGVCISELGVDPYDEDALQSHPQPFFPTKEPTEP